MEKLPKDIVNKLVEELSSQDFINFCASEVTENVKRICNSEELWNKRLNKDFPHLLRFRKLSTSKDYYLELFRRISAASERFTENVLSEYGALRKYLSSDFKTLLYNTFFDLCNETLKYIVEGHIENEDWVFDAIVDMYNSNKFVKFRDDYFPGTKDEERIYYEYWDHMFEVPFSKFIEEMVKYLIEK